MSRGQLNSEKDKCVFCTDSVSYIGHICISAKGISPGPEKIKAITNMPPPTDKKGVERLLGTINYLAKFIPNISEITQPIRSLLKKKTMFECSREQEESFKVLNQILSKEPVLTFFDVKKNPITVSVNASKSGLGAIIMQDK